MGQWRDGGHRRRKHYGGDGEVQFVGLGEHGDTQLTAGGPNLSRDLPTPGW